MNRREIVEQFEHFKRWEHDVHSRSPNWKKLGEAIGEAILLLKEWLQKN